MKKKALKIAGAITLSLAFAAAALEWNGYRSLDREDGSNVLCEKDTSCRNLTEGEIELARSVFGDTVDYKHIKIFSRPHMIVGGESHVTGQIAGMAPNGNIYFPQSQIYMDDFSQGDIIKKSYFIHEMAHVWQYQNGMNVRLAAMTEFIKNKFHYDYGTVYAYDDKIDFRVMNLEQQAHLIEDYFRTKTTIGSCYYSCDSEREGLAKLAKRLPPSLKPPPKPAP